MDWQWFFNNLLGCQREVGAFGHHRLGTSPRLRGTLEAILRFAPRFSSYEKSKQSSGKIGGAERDSALATGYHGPRKGVTFAILLRTYPRQPARECSCLVNELGAFSDWLPCGERCAVALRVLDKQLPQNDTCGLPRKPPQRYAQKARHPNRCSDVGDLGP